MEVEEENSDIKVDIRRDEELSERERSLVAEWTKVIFGDQEAKYEWAPQHWHVHVYCGDALVSHAAITERTALAGGMPVRLGGIGGVMTPPEWRGRGLAGKAMEVSVDFMRNKLRVDFGFLFCSQGLVAYYQKTGWQLVQGPVEFEQSSGRLIWREEAMVLPCRRRQWPAGIVDLCGPPW